MEETNIEHINNFYQQRWNYLLEVSRNILYADHKTINKEEMYRTLITESYYHFIKNDHLWDLNFEAKVVRWMTMQIKWTKSKFNVDWNNPKNKVLEYNNNENSKYNIENIIDEFIDIEDQLMYDLSIENKVSVLFYVVNNLDYHTKILFDLIYMKKINSSGKLSKYINVPRSAAYQLMLNLKKELKNEFEKHYNLIYGRSSD